MLRDWPHEWPPERIADVTQGEAVYLEPRELVRLVGLPGGDEMIEPRTIIAVRGMYLVESVSEPDDWYMGEKASDGSIVCWGKYGDIETALRAGPVGDRTPF